MFHSYTYSKGQKNRNDLPFMVCFEGDLKVQKRVEKSCNELVLLERNGYELDLSKEVLNIHFGLGGAEL